jgi:hypothetical protein
MSKSFLLLVLFGAVAAVLTINAHQPQLSVTDKIKSSLSIDLTIEQPTNMPTAQPIPKTISKSKLKQAKTSQSTAGLTEYPLPDHTLSGILAQQINRLMTSYLNGNLDDGYILAMNLSSCLGVPATEDELNEEVQGRYLLREQLREKINTDIDYSVASVTATNERIITKFHFCRGISEETAKLGRELIAEAAQQGHIHSQATYGAAFPPTDIEGSRGKVSDEVLEAWQTDQIKAMEYLKNAARHGSLDALVSLTSFNAMGVGIPNLKLDKQKLVVALAYCLTYLEFESEYIWLNNFKNRRDLIIKRLSPQEIAQAEEQSELLIQQILDKGTVYLR